jgi:hypothetical protein
MKNDEKCFAYLCGYGSIPFNTIFRGLFTSINPSYFDVNYRGTIGFDPLPYHTGKTYPNAHDKNPKVDDHGILGGLPDLNTSPCVGFMMK